MRLQAPLGYGSRGTFHVAGEETADIDLIIVVRAQLVPTIARHEVPFGRKIVVHAPHCEVAGGGHGNVVREAQNVGPVAFVLRAASIRLGFVGLPDLLNQGVDANPTRVDAWQGGHDASYRICYVSRYQGRRGHVPIEGLGVGETETFVISKEISLPPEKLFRDKPPAG